MRSLRGRRDAAARHTRAGAHRACGLRCTSQAKTQRRRCMEHAFAPSWCSAADWTIAHGRCDASAAQRKCLRPRCVRGRRRARHTHRRCRARHVDARPWVSANGCACAVRTIARPRSVVASYRRCGDALASGNKNEERSMGSPEHRSMDRDLRHTHGGYGSVGLEAPGVTRLALLASLPRIPSSALRESEERACMCVSACW